MVDFLNAATKLVVELDGDSHIENKAKDDSRQGWLERSGYRVVRIANDDVLRNLDGVLAQIERECGAENRPLPRGRGPPHRGGVRGPGVQRRPNRL